MPDKITPPGWYEAEEDQRVVFFEAKASGDLWSGRAWVNGVIICLIIYIGLALFVLLLIWIRA